MADAKDKMRNTEYAAELASSRLGDIRIERLFVKPENQEEIRISWWPEGRMANRPVDVPEKDLVTLLARGIREGVLSAQFLPRLIVKAAQEGTEDFSAARSFPYCASRSTSRAFCPASASRMRGMVRA